MATVDVLAFGPHPDDLEIGLGGTLAKHAALGHAVGLCDLTRGELASNGTPDQRVKEAEEARRVLGAAWRENLALPDRAIGSSPDHARRVAEMIRRCRPRAIALPYWHDRHPDHLAAATLLRDGVFNAKLRKYQAEGEPWQPEWMCFYFINDSAPASFVVDVSDYYDVKRRALACYASQFMRATGTAETRLNSPGFNQLIESRDAQFGALAGVRYAEGIMTTEPVVRNGLLKTS
ncbi:MAG TPA: bacillithiol biosynthesis deacetylase BshB1 [Vicinamibacterales bacterium]|jgi:bacillithiol biosynthesis deacetylase BshB1|nr:bacillithiol biosynthesis deacetylase BshB1 [Vicinamibacterales bacterium]